jgi:hypothetical protein
MAAINRMLLGWMLKGHALFLGSRAFELLLRADTCESLTIPTPAELGITARQGEDTELYLPLFGRHDVPAVLGASRWKPLTSPATHQQVCERFAEVPVPVSQASGVRVPRDGRGYVQRVNVREQMENYWSWKKDPAVAKVAAVEAKAAKEEAKAVAQAAKEEAKAVAQAAKAVAQAAKAEAEAVAQAAKAVAQAAKAEAEAAKEEAKVAAVEAKAKAKVAAVEAKAEAVEAKAKQHAKWAVEAEETWVAHEEAKAVEYAQREAEKAVAKAAKEEAKAEAKKEAKEQQEREQRAQEQRKRKR